MNKESLIDLSPNAIHSRQAREGIAKLPSTGGPVAQRLVQGTHNPFDQTGLRKKGCGHMELERK
jgi:hypothetical protein